MFRFLFLLCLLMVFSAAAFSQLPVQSLPHQSPGKSGYPPAFFPALQRQLNTAIPSLGSFAVMRQGKLVYAHYFNGSTDTTLFNIKSITKTVLSALGGIAQYQGKLPALQTPVLDILKEYNHDARPQNVWFAATRAEDDSIRKTLTLQHLLTMQTGFEWDDFGPLADAFVSSSDPVRFMLDLPFNESPGESFNYCSGASSIFEAVLEKSLNTDLKDYANMHLFNPIQVSLKKWDTDPTGRYAGASEMYLTTPDLLRFGLLYLGQGKANGKQVIPAQWIKESWAAQAVLNKWPVLPHPNGYGYFWWRRKTGGHQAYIASGAGGQILCVIPHLDMVIAATCFINEKNRGRMEIKRLHAFIDKVVRACTANIKKQH